MSHLFADFYRGKRVLVTGHTGFEGGWATALLKSLGAQVCGYGLPPATRPNFFDATLLDTGMNSIFADIRDRNSLAGTFSDLQPEIVSHCASQTSLLSSLQEPVDVFSTNLMGTVHILEEARLTHSVRAVVLLSSDSCGVQGVHSAREANGDGANHLLNATQASVELARSAFNKSYFQKTGTAVATARTAAAIGGGDWREGYIVPDLVHGITSGEPVSASKEKEGAWRIWHVLEPVHACLLLARNLFEHGQKSAGVWEFAPSDQDRIAPGEFAKRFTALWNGDDNPPQKGSAATKSNQPNDLGWSRGLNLDQALVLTVEWYRGFCSDPSSTLRTTENQLEQYIRMTSA